MTEPNAPTKTLNSIADIPATVASEDEEHEFWSTHDFGEEFIAQLKPIPDDELPPVRKRRRPITIRLDQNLVGRLRLLAARKGTGFETLAQEFISEQLDEEERREGILPPRGS